MSQALSLKNFSNLNILSQTNLTLDIAVATTSLPVLNSGDFTFGPILIGPLGSETQEMVTATVPTIANAIPLSSGTKLPHNNGSSIMMLFGDKIKIYTAADTYGGVGTQPPDTNFTPLATTPIDGNKTSTIYTDSVSPPGTWYKYTYFNSVSSAETQLSDSVAVQAGQFHYVSLDAIRTAAGFGDSPNITDAKIAPFRDAAEKEINGALLPVYSLPLPRPTNSLIVNVAKELAAGMLMEEQYTPVSERMAAIGSDKANKARNGGGHITSLQELVDRDVVLEDAKFTELTVDEGHGFGGFPDETTADVNHNFSNEQLATTGHDRGYKFWIDKEY